MELLLSEFGSFPVADANADGNKRRNQTQNSHEILEKIDEGSKRRNTGKTDAHKHYTFEQQINVSVGVPICRQLWGGFFKDI